MLLQLVPHIYHIQYIMIVGLFFFFRCETFPNTSTQAQTQTHMCIYYIYIYVYISSISSYSTHQVIEVPEGHCFLLPARVPHSPRREANSVGLVIERGHDHDPTELDRVRW
jgi:3-hydroxyanthranilate 3,4-dioxygenase